MIPHVRSAPFDVQKVTEYIKTHALILTLCGASIVALTVYAYSPNQRNTQDSALVTMSSITDHVRITGQVEPSTSASLAFQANGAVSYLGVKVGDAVKQGAVLAAIQSGDVQAGLMQAEANLASQRALYDQLLTGARPEERAIKLQALTNANAALVQAYTLLPDSIRAIDATAVDVLKSKLSPLFTNLGTSYILSFSSCDQRLASTVERERSDIENALARFQMSALLVTPIASNETVEKAFTEGYQSLVQLNSLINNLSSLLLSQCSASNTSLESYRTALSAVKPQISALFTSVSANKTALTTAKNVVLASKRDVELTDAGTDNNRLRSQAALVKQAEAGVIQAQALIEKSKIIAPFSGTISDVLIHEGETATQGKAVISMLTTDSYQIEAKIPEMDIVKIHLGSPVSVTLDAYGKGVTFSGVVTRINPTASMQGNVPVYTVLVVFTRNDDRIKSGMTANLSIEALHKDSALVLPLRYVTLINANMATVKVIQGVAVIERTIELGARGDNGTVEVLSGLRAGDRIITPEAGPRQAQKETNE